jgi:DNA-binding transcriptional ArsR family regulator
MLVLRASPFDLASFGELLGEPSRAAILLSLLDGSSRPASELAALARVTPATASSHLAKLVEGGLLVAEARGRHRYYRISGSNVAEALESIVSAFAKPPKKIVGGERLALIEARTCYRHLAGRLGVAWLAALEEKKLIELRDGATVLTPRAIDHFAELGLEEQRWPSGKMCLDWTERRSHLGGALGAILTEHLFRKKWIARRREGRAVRVTTLGRRELSRHFGMT